MNRLLFNRNCFIGFIKLDNTITLWIGHVISKDCCTLFSFIATLQVVNQLMTIKNIIAQNKTGTFSA